MRQYRTGKYSPIYKILILLAALVKNVPNTEYFRVKSQNKKDTRTGSVDFIYKKRANKEEIIFEWL
jgi:hypothetical protein